MGSQSSFSYWNFRFPHHNAVSLLSKTSWPYNCRWVSHPILFHLSLLRYDTGPYFLICFSFYIMSTYRSHMHHLCFLLCTVGGSLPLYNALSLLLAKVSWLCRGPACVNGKSTLTYVRPLWSYWNRSLTNITETLTGVEIFFSFLGLLFYNQRTLETVEVSTCCCVGVS